MKKFLFFLMMNVVLVACASKYQKEAYDGGYSEQKIDENTYGVAYVGNGYSTFETTTKLFLRRAAEVAKENGATHFTVLKKKNSLGGGMTGAIAKDYNFTPSEDADPTIPALSRPMTLGVVRFYKTEAPADAYNVDAVLAEKISIKK